MKFSNFLEDLRSTSKPKEKQKILAEYDCEILRYIIKATYEPFKMFHVNIKTKEIPSPGKYDLVDKFGELMKVLHFCETSNSNKQNREAVVELLKELDYGSQQLVVRILDKNWKAGVGAKNILKVFPDIISRFDVQLANTYKSNNDKHALVKEWLLSYKLDGLRCVFLRDEETNIWTAYSRMGKEFLTVEHLKPQLEILYRRNGWTFFDGELYRHGLAFEEIQGVVMAYTKGQAPDIQYHVFVAGDAKKFLACKDRDHVVALGGESDHDTPDIKLTCLDIIPNDKEVIYEWLEKAFEQGYEGIMLRDKTIQYDYKRSNALLKLKEGLDAETNETIVSDCVVTDIVLDDEFPVVEDEQMRFETMLVKIWVRQPDGVPCKVGGGFDLNFRRFFRDNQEDLIGKTVEIEHQKWGKNGRMRFPRFKRVRLDL